MKMRTFARSVLIASALISTTSCHRSPLKLVSSPAPAPCAVTLTSASGPAPAINGAPDVASLVARVKPAVLNITSIQDVKLPKIPLFREWPFGDSFGLFGPEAIPRSGEDEGRLKRQALGSGFIVDPRGYAVTNAHVVDHADRVRVRLADDRELEAKVKGRDERLDLAVLEIEGAKDLPTVVLGASDAVRVGQYVVAIGNPFGLGHTVTMGIVSAKSRAIGAGPYDDFIQTDASINPGNSGGPLFDTRGEVVGVNTAINPNGRGIGFAIPVDAVKDVLPQLIEKGHVARGRLGVHIQTVDDAMAKALGMERGKGALVGDVETNGAGAKAGLKAGDVIVAFDGTEISHAHDLPRIVARHAPGSRVTVEVLRDKSKKTFDVTLDELRDDPDRGEDERSSPSKTGPSTDGGGALGLVLEDDPGEGVVVRRVRANSPADGALEPGDVILEVDKHPIRNAREAVRELRAIRSGPAILRIRRHGVSRYVAIEP
jgi:serine protease Do